MSCRTFYNQDEGQKWQWGGWYCTNSPQNCPTGTWGDRSSEVRSNDKAGTNNSYCFGDTAWSKVNRENVKCRWNKQKYETDGYLNVDKVLPCCLGTRNGTTDAECHPDYCSGNALCNNWFKNTYCNTGDNIFSSECEPWRNANIADGDGILNTKCVGTKLIDSKSRDICEAWCGRNKANCKSNAAAFCTADKFNESGSYCNTKAVLFGDMDSAVREFCATHSDSEFCSCLKSVDSSSDAKDPTLKAILARPECYVSKCASGGYKTANMRSSGSCPPVNVCQNTLNALGNTTTGLTGITQSCDQQQGSSTPNSSTSSTSSTVSANASASIIPSSVSDLVDLNKKYSGVPLPFIYFIFLILVVFFGYNMVFPAQRMILSNPAPSFKK